MKYKALKVLAYLFGSLIILVVAMVYPLYVLHDDYSWYPCLLIYPLALIVVVTKDIGTKWVDNVMKQIEYDTQSKEKEIDELHNIL